MASAVGARECPGFIQITAPPTGDAAVLVCGLAISLLKVVQFAWYAFRRRRRGWQLAGELGGRLWRSLRAGRLPWLGGGAGEAAAGEERDKEVCVRQRINARVEANTIGAFELIGNTVALGAIISAVTILHGGTRIFTFGQAIVCVGLFAAVTFSSVDPQRFLSGRAGMVYGFVMSAICSIVLCAHPVAGNVFVTECILLIGRVALAVRYHKLRAVLFFNVAYLVCGVHALVNVLGVSLAGPIFSYQLWNVGAVVMLSCWAAQDAEADIRRQVEALALQGESSGLWTLLDLVCDVVVPLDEGLTIADKASRFGATVTLRGRSVEGMRLQEFMPREEDRRAFESCFHAEPGRPEPALPSALPVKLRDSLGNVIAVELFCVQFQTLLQRRRYFVGVRELGDALPIPESRQFPSRVEQVRRRRRRTARRRARRRTPRRCAAGRLRRRPRPTRTARRRAPRLPPSLRWARSLLRLWSPPPPPTWASSSPSSPSCGSAPRAPGRPRRAAARSTAASAVWSAPRAPWRRWTARRSSRRSSTDSAPGAGSSSARAASGDAAPRPFASLAAPL